MMGYPDSPAGRSILLPHNRLEVEGRGNGYLCPCSGPLCHWPFRRQPHHLFLNLSTPSVLCKDGKSETALILRKSRCRAFWDKWSLHLRKEELPKFHRFPTKMESITTQSSLTTVGKSSLVSFWIWIKG